MTSISEFIRRHRGKIIAGTVIAGGSYLASKYLRRYYEERAQSEADQNLAAAATAAFGMDPHRMLLQNRRFYIFDSNQRTCDNSIIQIIPSIKTKLQKHFDVETAADLLKKYSASNGGASADGDSGSINKLDMWNQMKIDAVSRLLSASVSYTILILSLKTQISILAAQIYDNTEKQSTPYRFESWYSRLWYHLGGRAENVKPRTGDAKPQFDFARLKNSSAVQQLFLQALQFFVNKGVDSVSDFIRSTISTQLSGLSLKEQMTKDQLRTLLRNLLKDVTSGDSYNHHFSYYVVPLGHTGALLDEPTLEELLILLKTVLESPDAQQVFEYGLNAFMDGTMAFVCKNLPEFQSNDAVQLAKLVPVLTDAFHEISRVNFDSVISNFIISNELHEYCVKVFDKDQSIW